MDHQHGLVTGFAIDKGVDLYFDVRGQMEDGRCDPHVHLESRTFEGTVDFDIDKPSQVREHHWGDYARGAKYALRKRFELKRGITGVIQGSLPVGGLSSSAAVLIAYVMAFAKANDIKLQPFEVVKIASEAEREYIGLNNGLLDQACIALSKKNQLMFLDCDSNEYRLIPFGGETGIASREILQKSDSKSFKDNEANTDGRINEHESHKSNEYSCNSSNSCSRKKRKI